MVFLDNAEELWEFNDDEVRDVVVPEWKINGEAVTVRLKALSGTDRDAYESGMVRLVKGKQVPDMVNARARLVGMCAINENGDKLFTGEGVLRLGMRNAKAVNRLWEAACELSGIDFDGSAEEKGEAGFSDAPSELSTSG